MSVLRFVIAPAIIALPITLLGCTGGKSSSGGSSNTRRVNPGGPGNTPTSVTQSDAVPRHFWVNYEFEPAGRRDWVKVGDGRWEERWANGTVVKYIEDGRYDIGGYNGVMVHPEAGGDYVLLPYGGKGAMLHTRPTKTGRNWSNLAEVAGVVKQ